MCAARGDVARRLVTPGTDTAGNYAAAVPSAPLLTNQFVGVPYCLAFTVAGISSTSQPALVYSLSDPLLSIGSTVTLQIGQAAVTFNLDLVDAQQPTRAQICVERSDSDPDLNNAVLYVNCQRVQSQTFQRSAVAAVQLIGVLGEPVTFNDTFGVSCIITINPFYTNIFNA